MVNAFLHLQCGSAAVENLMVFTEAPPYVTVDNLSLCLKFWSIC